MITKSFAQDTSRATPLGEEQSKISGNISSEIKKLKDVKEDQESFLSALSQERHQAGEDLIMQLFSRDNQVQCMAAFLLGMDRHEEAVNSLAEQITLQDIQYPRQQTRLWFWDQYPALEALVKIGKPSTRAMVTNLESSDDKLVHELSLKALRAIEGVDVAQFILERAIAKQEEPSKKANLEAALAELKKQPQ